MSVNIEKVMRENQRRFRYRLSVQSFAINILLNGIDKNATLFTHSKESGEKFIKDVSIELEKLKKIYKETNDEG